MTSSPPLRLARTQLGIFDKSIVVIPTEYLNELKEHLRICPNDTKFAITPEPKRGFGKLTCLEEGCNRMEMVLTRSRSIPDGGKKIGIGSLSVYREHVAFHSTHSKNRNDRLLGATSPKEPSVVDMSTTRNVDHMPSSPGQLPTPALPSSSPAVHPTSASRRLFQRDRLDLPALESDSDDIDYPSSPVASPIHNKSSPLVRKRSPSLDAVDPLDLSPSTKKIKADLEPLNMLFSLAKGSGASMPKTPTRVKAELTPKSPLMVRTNTVAPPSPAAAPASLDVSDVRGQIDNIQADISHKQSLLDRLLRKKKLAARDKTRIQHYKDELATLRFLKAELNASLPVMSPLKRNSSMVKVEPGLSQAAAGPSRAPWYASTDSYRGVKSEPIDISNPFNRVAIKQEQPTWQGITVKSEPAAHVVTKPEPAANLLGPPSQVNALAGPSNHNQAYNALTGSGHILHNPFLDDDDDLDPDGDFKMGYPENETVGANAIAMRFAGAEIPVLAPILQGEDNRDDQGNYFGRGKDLFQGPVAKADDIDKFLIEAGNAEAFDHNATVDEALKKLGLDSLYTPLPGMEVALMAHQAIGVAWMLEKEKSSHKGGCLADDMGLGKTVQMIACMMMNRSTDKKCKTTLILAPTALLDQWKLEIELKTNDALKCLIYHGSNKPKRANDLMAYDVVLTTFQTMAMEWPDVEQEEKKKKKKAKAKMADDGFIVSDDDEDEDLKPNNKKKGSGLLFRVDFYRIVLDEAQVIRNKKTRMSRAVTILNAKYRWCLTGTPIINGLSDTYPYIRFLQIRPWYDFNEFHGHIGRLEKKNPQLAITRLQLILNTFNLRRKKDTKLDGKILIDLPPKEVVLDHLEFTEEESEIYQAVEKQMQTQFNRFLRAGTVLKNYSTVLVLLLRLRQCCSHPALIQEEGVAFVAPDELDDAGRVLKRARDLVSPEFVANLKAKFKAIALERIEAEKESQEATIEEDDCPICYDNFTNAVVTQCGHVFCKDCIHDVFNTPIVDHGEHGAAHAAHQRPCPACRTSISKELLFERAAFLPSDEDLKEDGSIGQADPEIELDNAREKKEKAKKKAKRPIVLDSDESEDSMDDFIVDDDEDEEEEDARRALKKRLGKRKAIVVLDSDEETEDEVEKAVLFGKRKNKNLSADAIKSLPRFLPSTKMKTMMLHIRQLFEEKPNEKVLVISQWTSCLTLVSQYLEENGILHVKYQGDMSRPKRDAAVRTFMSKDKARVMLMSLKCGGVGLNLTRANNVISLDLGWSQAIEAQAFDRVHRLGQTLPVKVSRLVISNTVEDRILNMQARKQTLADGSLGEGNAKKIAKMNVKQLAELFGLDGHGRLLQNKKDD